MLRLSTWNIKWFGQLLQGKTRTTPQKSRTVTDNAGKALQALQIQQIGAQIEAIDPDILCIQEGPSTGNVARLEAFCADTLRGGWTVVKRPAAETYLISGAQGIFFLVRTSRLRELSPSLTLSQSHQTQTDQPVCATPTSSDGLIVRLKQRGPDCAPIRGPASAPIDT
jgi:hypothetical protein